MRAHFLIVDSRLLDVMDEMATRPVRAESDRVEGAAQLGLVFRMAGKIAQFAVAMSELTLVAIFTGAAFLERPAQLGFVAGRRLARAAVQFAMLFDQRGDQRRVAATQRRMAAIVPGPTIASGVGRRSRR